MKRIFTVAISLIAVGFLVSGCSAIGIPTLGIYAHVDKVASSLDLGKGLKTAYERDSGGLFDSQPLHQIVVNGADAPRLVADRLATAGCAKMDDAANPDFSVWEGNSDGKQVTVAVEDLVAGQKFDEEGKSSHVVTAKRIGVSIQIT